MSWKRVLGLVGTAAAGAGAMYLLDPDMGRRRKSIARAKIAHFGRLSGRAVGGRFTDVKNRAYGMYCEIRAAVGSPCATTRFTGRTHESRDIA